LCICWIIKCFKGCFLNTLNSSLPISSCPAFKERKKEKNVRLPEFLHNRHVIVVKLSALRTSRLYPRGRIAGTHFCWRLSVAGRNKSMKILKNIIGNRTGDLPGCSAVSQPAAPRRASDLHLLKIPKYKERFAKFETTSEVLLRIQAICEVMHCLWVRATDDSNDGVAFIFRREQSKTV